MSRNQPGYPYSTLVYHEIDSKGGAYTDVALYKYVVGKPVHVFPKLAYTKENKDFCSRIADELNKKMSVHHER
jgi:hypothetical protein